MDNQDEKLKKNLRLTKKDLWKIANCIVNCQKTNIQQEVHKEIDWDMLEEEWFDWLEEELTKIEKGD